MDNTYLITDNDKDYIVASAFAYDVKGNPIAFVDKNKSIYFSGVFAEIYITKPYVYFPLNKNIIQAIKQQH